MENELNEKQNSKNDRTPKLKGHMETNGYLVLYEGWNLNSGNYLFTTDAK